MDQNDMLPDGRNNSEYDYTPIPTNYNTVPTNLDYVGKNISDFSGTQIPAMNIQPDNVSNTYQFNTSIQPVNLYTNEMDPSYQQLNQASSGFNQVPGYDHYPPKEEPVELGTHFSVPSSGIHASGPICETSYTPPSSAPANFHTMSSLPPAEQHLNLESVPNYSFGSADHATLTNEYSGDVPRMMNVSLVPKDEFQCASLDTHTYNNATLQDGHSNAQTYTTLDNSNLTQTDISNASSECSFNMDTNEYNLEAARNVVIGDRKDVTLKYVSQDSFSDDLGASAGNASTAKGDDVMTSVTKEELIDTAVKQEIPADIVKSEPSEKTIKEEDDTKPVNGQSYETENEVQEVQICIRSGCANHAVNNPEWEQEFCSNDCVVLHCRNVFTAWIKANEVNSQ